MYQKIACFILTNVNNGSMKDAFCLLPRARSIPLAVRHFRARYICVLLGSLVLLAAFSTTGAAQDTENPPVGTPTPGPIPADVEAAYIAARTPRAIITVGNPASTDPQMSAVKAPRKDAGVRSNQAAMSAGGGMFPATFLISPGGAPAAKGTKAGTSAAPRSGGGVPPVDVTLQFDPTRAGALVWLSMLDGGNLSALDAQGGVVNAQGGFFMEISAAGTVAFTYQAPNIGGHYQVVARLDNVSTVLPFDVPDRSDN